MFTKLREPFGKAGLIVAVVALVAALGGGAYAANHSAHASKAKQGKQGKPGKPGATGATGPAGAAGPAGPKGDTGAPGAAGTNGTNGTNGKNGTDGTTGFTETLPEGETETGAWSFQSFFNPEFNRVVYDAISFPIPLEAALDASHAFQIAKEKEGTVHEEECPGTVAEPKAKEGYLCVYTAEQENIEIFPPALPSQHVVVSGAGKTGALLKLGETAGQEAHVGFGTWAVTAAPEAP